MNNYEVKDVCLTLLELKFVLNMAQQHPVYYYYKKVSKSPFLLSMSSLSINFKEAPQLCCLKKSSMPFK